MQEELGALLAAMPDEQRVRVAGRDFWVGHLHGQAVVAVLSRIGKVAAATTATVLLERFGVRAHRLHRRGRRAGARRARSATWWWRPSCCSTTWMPRRSFPSTKCR